MHEASPLVSEHAVMDDSNQMNDEAQGPSSFANIVSIHLHRLSNGLTPETRKALLELAHAESAPIKERVAAAGLLYLNDEGTFEVEAEKVLKELISSKNLPPAEAIAEYVCSVLWNHWQFADELISQLQRVLAEFNTAMDRKDDAIISERIRSNAVDTRQSQPKNPRKRNVDQVIEESDSNKEQRVASGSVSVCGNNVRLSQEEKSVLSAGRKKGTMDGKKSKSLNQDDLRVFYLKTHHGKMNPSQFDLYLRGYKGTNKTANGCAAEIETARLGSNNGHSAARKGLTLKSEKELKIWYHDKHPEASDDAASAYAENYIKAYNELKSTPVGQAERSGRKNGTNAARQGSTLKSKEALKTAYKKEHPEASDDAANAYAESYLKVCYTEKGTSVEWAERLGRKNGANTARQGNALKSKEALKAAHKKEHPEASDAALDAYAKSYLKAYVETIS
jgi:hypothetical protein